MERRKVAWGKNPESKMANAERVVILKQRELDGNLMRIDRTIRKMIEELPGSSQMNEEEIIDLIRSRISPLLEQYQDEWKRSRSSS